MPDTRYPGEAATAADLRALAEEYRRAAVLVRTLGRRGEAISRAPFRLLAIQAVELYLTAFLVGRGRDAASVRALGHDLARRADLAAALGLVLRVRTRAHLGALGSGREYLASRYAPERAADASQLNRLAATLEEVARRTAP